MIYITQFVVALVALTLSSISAAAQPNVVIIFNDDQGYQDLGCYGSPDIKTPRVDQLAHEGMRFTDFYVASSVCSPSRAALLTGQYPERVGVPGVFFPNRNQGGLSPEHVTVAETLGAVGYATMAVGKWHLGDQPAFLPTNQGFDAYFGIPYSNDMFPARDMAYADDCDWREGTSPQTVQEAFAGELLNGCPVSMRDKVPLMRDTVCVEFPADQATLTRRFADEGIRFIGESVAADRPFFLYLANSMPHVPLFASPEFAGQSERGLYGDVIQEIDHHTGRVLDYLETLGVADDTIVIFTSDNGPWLAKGERGGSAYPLFEGKMTKFEGGIRVPAIIRWPGHIPAGSICREVASTMDLLPTLAHVADAPLPAAALDGRNILDLLTKTPNATSPHKSLFFGRHAVRSGDWKYHAREVFRVPATKRDANGPTLYNLRDDVGESRNVIAEHPGIADRLARALAEHTASLP